jgi:hypothetical protein
VQEANKKRAELAAKRKEREEKHRQPGTGLQPVSSTQASTTAAATSTTEMIKKPRIEGQVK